MKERIIVGLAKVSNCYGGPEEGGWYYSSGEPIENTAREFDDEAKAEAYADKLRASIRKGEGFRGVAVGGCGDEAGEYCRGQSADSGLEVVTQRYPAGTTNMLKAWPDETPRYE